jgi:hypothetical protein
MFYRRACAVWVLAVVTVLTLPADAQSVISTRSGIVHFFEGAVYLGDRPLESHPGRFSGVPAGAELRTGEGRAEVLLTPGVFIRIGERTAIRMVANELSNTRVELLAGSAIVDSAEPNSGTSVTLIYRNWNVRFLEHGVYRIDSDPPRLWVLQGKAEVSADTDEGALLVGQGMYVPFAPVLVPDQSIDQPHDSFSNWVEGRQQSISADNAIAANIQDPASMNTSTSGLDSFTNFPMLGLSPLGVGLSSTYNSLGTYQPGFNSLYLPGYTYLPFEPSLFSTYSFLGTYQPGFNSVYLPGYGPGRFPTPIGLPHHPGLWPSPLPHPVPRPIPVHPISPHPIPVHPISGVGTHGSPHR